MLRWLRSLHAQFFLWAVLPITFVIIALAFTGVYAHQREMRDFVAGRDMALAHLTARLVEDGLAHGLIDQDGQGLAEWLSYLSVDRLAPPTIVLSSETLTLVDPQQAELTLIDNLSLAEVLQQHSGSDTGEAVIISNGEQGAMLVTLASVTGTDWFVVVQEPAEAFIDPILRLPNVAPLVALGAGLLFVFLVAFSWHTVARPLRALARAASLVSWGDNSAISEKPVGGVQEVRDLHSALAEMVERIRGYETGMRDYLGAVTQGQEAERARLARELHDGPVQELIALRQQTEIAQRWLQNGKVDAVEELLSQLHRSEEATMAELRRLVSALRPVYLEDLGFVPALEMLVQQAFTHATASIRLEKEGPVHRLPPDIELTAYRIAQEALNNALQHADASEITIHVRCDEDGITLSVIDDGVGFILPQRPDILTRDGHFGLMGMQERATRLGGSFRIHTAPGAGTSAIARLPARCGPP